MNNNNINNSKDNSKTRPAKFFTLSKVALGILFISSGVVSANESDKADNDAEFELEQIMVTATKRSMGLQDVPLTIQAIGEDELQSLGANGVEDFVGFVPGLNRIGTNFVIRGLSSQAAGGRANSNTTSRYLDEIPIDHNFHLFDVSRVEVLKGPQGTLYGAGAMGGTIRLITNQPELDIVEGKIASKLSNTDNGGTNYEIDGMFNIPLIDEKMALRVVAYDRYNDGYIDDVGLDVNNINDDQKRGFRTTLRLDATDDLSITASYMYENAEQGTRNNAENVGYDSLKSFSLIEGGVQRKVSIANLLINWDLGWGHLTSNTARTKTSLEMPATDATGLLNPVVGGLLTLFSGGTVNNSSPYDKIYQDFSNDAESWTQEIRLVSLSDSQWQWVVGGYYREDDLGPNNILIYADEVDPNEPPVFLGFEAGEFTGLGFNPGFIPFDDPSLFFEASQIKAKEREMAAFGELTYHASDSLFATVGVRYLDVKQEFDSAIKSSLLLLNAPSDKFGAEQGKAYYKGMIGFEPTNDVLLYLNWAQGFRRGGANPASAVALGALQDIDVPTSYESDTVDSWELGAHTAWFDERLIINGAIYQQKWKDIRVDIRSGVNYTTNAAEATIRGVELELQARPTQGLSLAATVNYIDPELTKGSDSLADSGQRLPAQPEYTYSVSASYEIPELIADFNGYFRIDSSYTGSSYNTFESGPASVTVLREKMDSYLLTNIRTGLVRDDGWDVALFVTNLSNKSADLFIDQAAFGRQVIERNRPRTIGINVVKAF